MSHTFKHILAEMCLVVNSHVYMGWHLTVVTKLQDLSVFKLIGQSDVNKWHCPRNDARQRHGCYKSLMWLITKSDVQCINTSSSAIAGTARRLKSIEILSAAAQLYEKSQLTRRLALSCGIKISPVGSLDKPQSTRVTDGRTDRQNYDFQVRASIAASRGKNHFFYSS